MCGIVGLHLRDETLYPRLGELLTGMLCEMEDRGQDSAGVAVYGDPVWSPEGHSCVSLLSEDESGLAEAVTARLGSVVPLVSVERLGDTTLLTAPVASEELLAAVRAVRPDALVAGFGSDLTVLKGVGHPRALAATWQLEKAQLAGRGAHPDGHRVGRHPLRRPPLRGRPGTVPGAQRLVLQPRHDPP